MKIIVAIKAENICWANKCKYDQVDSQNLLVIIPVFLNLFWLTYPYNILGLWKTMDRFARNTLY